MPNELGEGERIRLYFQYSNSYSFAEMRTEEGGKDDDGEEVTVNAYNLDTVRENLLLYT